MWCIQQVDKNIKTKNLRSCFKRLTCYYIEFLNLVLLAMSTIILNCPHIKMYLSHTHSLQTDTARKIKYPTQGQVVHAWLSCGHKLQTCCHLKHTIIKTQFTSMATQFLFSLSLSLSLSLYLGEVGGGNII